MKNKKFATIEELKTQAIKDEACRAGMMSRLLSKQPQFEKYKIKQ